MCSVLLKFFFSSQYQFHSRLHWSLRFWAFIVLLKSTTKISVLGIVHAILPSNTIKDSRQFAQKCHFFDKNCSMIIQYV